MHTMSVARSAELFERANTRIPGGVNSPVRAMGSVGREHPLFIRRGFGARVEDADGNHYTDWMLSWGALPLGHAHPAVVEAVERALRDGSSFGASTEREVELAELMCEAVPSLERVRFVSSGTEATMSALRVARAATGRDHVITFQGCYHGHADPFLATGGSGLATLSIPSSPGVPTATAELTLTARFNDLDSVRAAFEAAAGDVAAIFVEPVAANMGVVPPRPGFLEGLRDLCREAGALLVFDEVITGFRLGMDGAQGRFGVEPDLSTFGKIVGGGLPVGAFGGRAELMDLVAPAGQVYQAGTLSGNPLAMAAGLAQLRELARPGVYEELERLGDRTGAALEEAVREAGVPAAVQQVGSLVTLFHLPNGDSEAPANFDDAKRLETGRFACMHAGALMRGHLLPPSQYEALFVSTAHDDAAIRSLGEAVTESLAGEVTQ